MLRRKLNRTNDANSSDSAYQSKEIKFDRPETHRAVLGATSESKSLEQRVFGGQKEFKEKLQQIGSALVNEDTSSDDELPDEVSVSRTTTVDAVCLTSSKPKWVDDDDSAPVVIPPKSKRFSQITSFGKDPINDGLRYSAKLKTNFAKSFGATVPKWAAAPEMKQKRRRHNYSDDSDDDDDNLLCRTGSYIGQSSKLPQQTVKIKRLCDLTSSHRIKASLNTTEFHKRAQLLMAAGYTQRLMLYQINGDDNPLLHSVDFKGFPIETAHFSADGERIFVGSKMHTYFHVYDMLSEKVLTAKMKRIVKQHMGRFVLSPDSKFAAFCANSGMIHLVSASTCDYVGALKTNGKIGSMCFSADGSLLYSHGDEGQVYVWDVNSRRCINRFSDEGCLYGTALAVSADGEHIACGSNSGVVNLYSCDIVHTKQEAVPLKSIVNLTTPIDRLAFNPTNEILAYSSGQKEKAVRMFHMASRSTFDNYPVFQEKLSNLTSLGFSPNSGYFSCGNNNGQVFLYRLLHYGSY